MIFNLANIPFEALKQELPSDLGEMADVISAEAVIKLVDTYGGQVLYVPANPHPDSYLVMTIGKEGSAALCEHYHGCEVFVPKLDKLRRSYRDLEIIAKSRSGRTVRELSSHYGLSSRSIRKILSRAGGVVCN